MAARGQYAAGYVKRLECMQGGRQEATNCCGGWEALRWQSGAAQNSVAWLAPLRGRPMHLLFVLIRQTRAPNRQKYGILPPGENSVAQADLPITKYLLTHFLHSHRGQVERDSTCLLACVCVSVRLCLCSCVCVPWHGIVLGLLAPRRLRGRARLER